MNKQDYLYGEGVDVPEVDSLIVLRRIELLQIHLGELLEHSYYTRDIDRVRSVLRDISYWENLNPK